MAQRETVFQCVFTPACFLQPGGRLFHAFTRSIINEAYDTPGTLRGGTHTVGGAKGPGPCSQEASSLVGRKAITQSMKCDSCYEGNRVVEAKGQCGGGDGVQGRWARIPLSYDLGQTWVGREEEHLGKELDFCDSLTRLLFPVWGTFLPPFQPSCFHLWPTPPHLPARLDQVLLL